MPCSSAASCTPCSTAPASTTASASTGSISTMRFIFSRESATSVLPGSAPATTPVSPPCVMTVWPASWQSRSISDTSSVERGSRIAAAGFGSLFQRLVAR